MTNINRYCIAIWKEGQIEIEDIVPCCWIDTIENVLYYPKQSPKPVKELIKACALPQISWFTFQLLKLKQTSCKKLCSLIISQYPLKSYQYLET